MVEFPASGPRLYPLLRNMSGVIILLILAAASAWWLFIWLRGLREDLTFLREIQGIERRIAREHEEIRESSVISGRVLEVKEQELVMTSDAVEAGMLRVLVVPETKIYEWAGEEELKKEDIALSRIVPRSLITVESAEIVDHKTAITSREILKVE